MPYITSTFFDRTSITSCLCSDVHLCIILFVLTTDLIHFSVSSFCPLSLYWQILRSSLRSRLQKSGLASLTMFYDDLRKDRHGLPSSVLPQLCGRSDFYYNIFSNSYSAHRDGAQTASDDEQVLQILDKLTG